MASTQKPFEQPQWLTSLIARFFERGFDLAQTFRADWYNDTIDAAYQLPRLADGQELGLVVGNTRLLWEHFVAALQSGAVEPFASNPFDNWVTMQIESIVSAVPVRLEMRYAHEQPPRRVSMIKLAQVSGLAWLSPAHLCIHPEFGPWFALRAVLVFDAPGPSGSARSLPAISGAYPKACETALNRALEGGDWSDWLAVRDACPIGRAYRYGEAQTRYHYTRDPQVLRFFSPEL